MRILFICGSLEPGRDGVGDYTRRLAAELISRGNPAGIIALNERNRNHSIEEIQESGGIKIKTLRLTNKVSYKERFVQAQQWVDDFNPEWLSLQYVPFSFQKKGFPFGLAKRLNRLGKGRKWHIMFHELWMGMYRQAPKKKILPGKIQRQIIKAMISDLNPLLINTNTHLYQAQIARLGFKSKRLPLFSNIPVVKEDIPEIIKQNGSGKISMVLFGSIRNDAPLKEFIEEAAAYYREKKQEAEIIFLGRCGNEVEYWASVCKSAGLPAKIIGEQKAGIVSAILSSGTIGIATTPFALAEKSGSIAAMHAHGLPVICVGRQWDPDIKMGTAVLPGVLQYRKGHLNACLEKNQNPVIGYTVSSVSIELLQTLKSHETGKENLSLFNMAYEIY